MHKVDFIQDIRFNKMVIFFTIPYLYNKSSWKYMLLPRIFVFISKVRFPITV